MRCWLNAPCWLSRRLLRCAGFAGLGWVALGGASSARAQYSPLAQFPVTLRARGGLAIHCTASDRVPGQLSGAFELALGLPIRIQSAADRARSADLSLFIYPELGYSYQDTGQHLFTVGGHVGYGVPAIYGSYSLRFLAGRQGDETAVGLRHGLGLHVYNDILSLEVNHQPLWVAGDAQHDVILWLGFNPVQIYNLAVMAWSTP